MAQKLSPISPGEILFEEFMKPLSISQNKLARDLDVPVGRISDILRKNRAITPDTALRLSIYFSTTAEFWINLQSRYDLKITKRHSLAKIKNNVRPLLKAA
jgi:addiction module HigA family antidote